MQLDYAAFTFIFTLAAVVNGLGIVRWLSVLADFVRHRDSLRLGNYHLFIAFAAFQFLLHVLLWWSLWGIRSVDAFNFLDYLFLLTGPVLLFLGSSLLVPDAEQQDLDLDAHFDKVRSPYATVLAFAWLWSLLLWPILRGVVPPTMPLQATFLVLALALRFSRSRALWTGIAVANWLALASHIALFSMELGGVTHQL